MPSTNSPAGSTWAPRRAAALSWAPMPRSALVRWTQPDHHASRTDLLRAARPVRANDGSALRDLPASLTWVGHATFVMRLGGRYLTVDPVWSERIQGVIPRQAPPGHVQREWAGRAAAGQGLCRQVACDETYVQRTDMAS